MIFVHNVLIMLINLLYDVVVFCCNRPCCTELWGWKDYISIWSLHFFDTMLKTNIE